MMVKNNKPIILFFVVVVIIGLIGYFEFRKPDRGAFTAADITLSNESSMKLSTKTLQYPRAKELVNTSGFINTDGVTVEEFIGNKVVLIDFWTYSCINCQRTTPYLNAWWEKYKDQGLMILGVHTPEFEFEKNYANVSTAVEKFGISYPVVLDNDYGTWSAYRNRYWPRKYLIDIDGFVVYDHIGEGGYEETERKIQELLEERKQKLGKGADVARDVVSPSGTISVEGNRPRSPEIYFGAWRNLRLGNGKTETIGTAQFTEPTGIKTNVLYLDGTWNVQKEYAESAEVPAKIIFRYQGKNVYMVATSEEGANITVLRDGEVVGAEAGADTKQEGKAVIQENRLYHLIEEAEYGEHTLEIIVDDPGARIFTFTFG
jgi:thiol-disulfide isomerase/thioredoxin